MYLASKQCRECYNKSRRGQYVKRICLSCGDEFVTHFFRIEAGYGFYCSRKCARKGSPTKPRTRQKVWCTHCGRFFDKHKSEIKRRAGNKHFCSPDCWYAFNKGERHYGWQGGQDERNNPQSAVWRKAVVEREQGRCRLCLSSQEPIAHHIKKFSTHPKIRWEMSNGVLLCRDCHKIINGHEVEMENILYTLANTPHRIVKTYGEFCEAIATLGVPDDYNEKEGHSFASTEIF